MATLTSSSSSSSPRCVPFGFRRGRARGLPAPAGGAVGCGRPLCRAAEVVGGGIRGAFFASLDRCNCVEVSTKHDDDSFRMLDTPLMRDAAAAGVPGASADEEGAAAGGPTTRRPSGKGGNKQRRGHGCCTAANSTVN